MATLTQKVFLEEMKKRDDEMKKREALADVRFEFLKEQIQGVNSNANSNQAELKTEIAYVRKDVAIIRDQTAHITERITMIENKRKKEISS